MAKKAYRVRNWREYNKSLVNRGNITFWIDENCIKKWENKNDPKGRGRPEKYTDFAIEAGLTIKALLKLTFRATEGFIKSIINILKLSMTTPHYTLLCKRQKNLSVTLPKISKDNNESLHLAIDTTGLKVYGEGEWKVRQRGWVKHRLWRKLHLAVNTNTHEIEAFELTDLGVQDCEGLPLLVKKIAGPIDAIRADGSYDRFSCYNEAEQRKFRLITPPQRNAALHSERKNKKKTGLEGIRKRDEQIKSVRELGRKEWKAKVGYHKRSLSETAMFRVKTMLGNRLSTRILEHQKVEVGIWCKIINKMTSIGMPDSIAI